MLLDGFTKAMILHAQLRSEATASMRKLEVPISRDNALAGLVAELTKSKILPVAKPTDSKQMSLGARLISCAWRAEGTFCVLSPAFLATDGTGLHFV